MGHGADLQPRVSSTRSFGCDPLDGWTRVEGLGGEAKLEAKSRSSVGSRPWVRRSRHGTADAIW
jgi:hypothetical protein